MSLIVYLVLNDLIKGAIICLYDNMRLMISLNVDSLFSIFRDDACKTEYNLQAFEFSGWFQSISKPTLLFILSL
jgi:hypothetical protein